MNKYWLVILLVLSATILLSIALSTDKKQCSCNESDQRVYYYDTSSGEIYYYECLDNRYQTEQTKSNDKSSNDGFFGTGDNTYHYGYSWTTGKFGFHMDYN